MKERYVKQGSPTRMTQEQQFTEAKRILDMHINYLSRGCYYYFRDAIARYDEEALECLRDYRHHENSDQLVSSLTEHFNDKDALAGGKMKNQRQRSNTSLSPVRMTNANVASQDRVRASMNRDISGTLRTDFGSNDMEQQP